MSDSSLALSSAQPVMPAYLKPFVIDVVFTALHARITQSRTSACVALLIFLVLVKVCRPSDIHFSHSARIWFLTERFTEMSNGCNFLVRPPGITAVVVLCSFLKVFRTSSSMCALKLSKIRGDVLSKKDRSWSPNFLAPNSHSIAIRPSFAMAVDNHTIWELFFWHCFAFKDDHWFELFP